MTNETPKSNTPDDPFYRKLFGPMFSMQRQAHELLGPKWKWHAGKCKCWDCENEQAEYKEYQGRE